jgi:hypothetical protein
LDQITAQGEDAGEEIGHRDDDDLADKIGGDYPLAVDPTGADPALDIR